MKQFFIGMVVTAIIAVAGPQIAQAGHKQMAEVVISNKTGREIEYVTLSHKYSSNYKNPNTWCAVANDTVTRDKLIVEYNTGFLTTGVDWWLVCWKFKGDNTIYRTDACPFRPLIDDVEKVTMSLIPFVAGAATDSKAGKTAVEAAALGLLNSESTAGYKKHTLRYEDSMAAKAKPTVIEIGKDLVKFQSPSGQSVTHILK